MSDDQPAPRRRRRKRGTPATEAAHDAAAIASSDTMPGATDPAPEPASAPPVDDTPPLFAGAPHQAGFPAAPNLQRGFQTIVQDLYESEGYDPKTEWAEIRAGLEIKDALTPDRLKRAANGQEKLADRAHQLYIVTLVEVRAYMRETEATYGAIRTAATQALEVEKANKTRTKQITDADVKAEAARMYPTEWHDINDRREKAEGMLKHIENLAQLARSRCYTVSNMASPGNRSV